MHDPTIAERRVAQARARVQRLEAQLRKANEELTDAVDEWVSEWMSRVKGEHE